MKESYLQTNTGARRFRQSGACVLMVALIAAVMYFYWWTAMPPLRGALAGPDDRSYFNLLARGFMKGQLSMDVPVDPAMLTLENPWDPGQRAGRGLHDATYYEGKYYLYFGAGPIMVLYLPFRLLAGTFVSDTMAQVTFASVGFMASVWILLSARRRFFPGLGWGWTAACVVAVGVATMVPAILRRPSIWEVPITSAYACLMVGLGLLYQAILARRKTGWLVLSSLAFGMAVASRPTHLFGCIALVVPLAVWAWQRGGLKAAARDRDWRSWTAATVLPLACVGLALAAYNYFRFDSPLEFGQTYQMAGEDVTKLKLFSWRYPLYGFQLYMLEPAGWSPYFPFVTVIDQPPSPPGHFGIENPYGILPNIPFVLLVLGGWLLWRRGWWKESTAQLRIFFSAVFLMALMTSFTVMCFGGVTNRYMVDFVPSWIILACLGTFAVLSAPGVATAARRLAGTLIAMLLAFSVFFNVFVSFQHNELLRIEFPELYRKVALPSNSVAQVIERVAGVEHGPLELKVIFPSAPPGSIECLVATGSSFRSDYVYVHYLDAEHVRFGFDHTSYGGPVGKPVRVRAGEVQTVRIEMGSFYPPAAHPYFAGMSPTHARLLQRRLSLSVDGQVALEGTAEFYDSTSWAPSVGDAGKRPGFTNRFSGTIVSQRRLSGEVPTPAEPQYGPVRLTLRFPPFSGVRSEPLLCSGEFGRGDLIFVRFDSPTHITLGHDNWGGGGRFSEPIAIDYAAEHVLEIDYGALYPRDPATPWAGAMNRDRVVLTVNGHVVLDVPAPFHPTDPDLVIVGTNGIRASTASAAFTGTLSSIVRPTSPK